MCFKLTNLTKVKSKTEFKGIITLRLICIAEKLKSKLAQLKSKLFC